MDLSSNPSLHNEYYTLDGSTVNFDTFLSETAACPVCGKDAQAFGRRAMQIVFRCQGCKVLFKRAHNLSFDF